MTMGGAVPAHAAHVHVQASQGRDQPSLNSCLHGWHSLQAHLVSAGYGACSQAVHAQLGQQMSNIGLAYFWLCIPSCAPLHECLLAWLTILRPAPHSHGTQHDLAHIVEKGAWEGVRGALVTDKIILPAEHSLKLQVAVRPWWQGGARDVLLLTACARGYQGRAVSRNMMSRL